MRLGADVSMAEDAGAPGETASSESRRRRESMFDLCRAEEVETQDVFVASFSPLAWIVHLGSLLSASQPVCQCSFTQDQIIAYLSMPGTGGVRP